MRSEVGAFASPSDFRLQTSDFNYEPRYYTPGKHPKGLLHG